MTAPSLRDPATWGAAALLPPRNTARCDCGRTCPPRQNWCDSCLAETGLVAYSACGAECDDTAARLPLCDRCAAQQEVTP